MPSPNNFRVREFRTTFGQPVRLTPTTPPVSELNALADFIESEVVELRDAIAAGDMTEVIDALADIMYFAEGGFVLSGVNSEYVLQEVHRSNMSKLWPASASLCEKHLIKLGLTDDQVTCESIMVDGVGQRFRVRRKSDNKVMKGPDYSPPNLAQYSPANFKPIGVAA